MHTRCRPGDTNVFSLAKNLPKWDLAGRMKEQDHHYLHGVDVHPNAGKELVSVQVTKPAPAYVVFWGATGVTAPSLAGQTTNSFWSPDKNP